MGFAQHSENGQMACVYKNLHYFTAKFARPIEKHSKAVVYCVHKANGGMADEKAVVLCVQYGTIIL